MTLYGLKILTVTIGTQFAPRLTDRRIYEKTPYEECPNCEEMKHRPLGYCKGTIFKSSESLGKRCKECKYVGESDWKPETESFLTAMTIDMGYKFSPDVDIDD